MSKSIKSISTRIIKRSIISLILSATMLIASAVPTLALTTTTYKVHNVKDIPPINAYSHIKKYVFLVTSSTKITIGTHKNKYKTIIRDEDGKHWKMYTVKSLKGQWIYGNVYNYIILK